MKFSVFIGRFQPFHLGHYEVVLEALKQTDHLFIVIGSHNQPRSIRNPFTTKERIDSIKAYIYEEKFLSRITFVPIEDQLYREQNWIQNIHNSINTSILVKYGWSETSHEIYLIGHRKDNSSYYLDLFPTWNSISVNSVAGLNSTDIRNNMFEKKIIPKRLRMQRVSLKMISRHCLKNLI